MSIEGMAQAVSSAQVLAPARQMARSATAQTSCIAGVKSMTLALVPCWR